MRASPLSATKEVDGHRVVIAMYRSVWRYSVLLAGAAGVWESSQVWSFGGALFLFLFLALTAACIRLVIAQEGDRPPWRPAFRTGLAWSSGSLAALGLYAWLGVTGLAVVVLLCLLSPTVLTALVDRAGHRRRGEGALTPGRPGSSTGRSAPDPDSGCQREPSAVVSPSFLGPWIEQPLSSMNDATLCFAWRTSFVALQQPVPLAIRMSVVDRRQEFLDEFERRNARGFEAWLASGARAAGDPTKYIASAHGQVRRDQR